MNYVVSTSSGALSEAIAELVGKAVSFASNAVETVALKRQYRQTVSELSSLSGRELADLGLNRSSIHAAAYEAVYG
ncbi:DUF1127 domain-containing protein [uncultured Lentibacter sp.]|uniref:DUF1127 domain-containing protein n=1 Tax=uncultured Lentibacter sp. TaxID=1659309 RepID=UPI00261C8DBA|nr:DUF1127 domain-containing protein [uncultured Lentibacter sp.]